MDRIPNTRPSLLVRLRAPDDEQAWAEFLEVYEPLVYRFARRKGLQDADAREVSQEVFLAVASAIDRWNPDSPRGKFRSWLFRIARNLTINFLAKHRRHSLATGGSDAKQLLEQVPDPMSEDTAVFDREYERETFAWAVRQIHGDFHDTTWNAFWLTSVEGREPREVAALLGVKVGSVYMSRSRVMARLRGTIERLEGRWPTV